MLPLETSEDKSFIRTAHLLPRVKWTIVVVGSGELFYFNVIMGNILCVCLCLDRGFYSIKYLIMLSYFALLSIQFKTHFPAI